MEKVLPLCIDLDGTLILSDTMYEAVLKYVKAYPLQSWRIISWLAKGRAYAKEQLGQRIELRADLFPYNQTLLAYMKEQKKSGVPVYLVSGTSHYYGQAVAEHLGIFNGVITSNPENNLIGGNKATALVERFGEKGYIYAGNASVDVIVWQHAAKAIVVNASKSLAEKAMQVTEVEKIIPGKPFSWRTVLKAMRLHQWVKNLLVFVPLVMAHGLFSPTHFTEGVIAFIAFSFTASTIYFLNDLLDIEADRQHPRKKNRPFAAGTLTIPDGLMILVSLGVIAGIFASALPSAFGIYVGIYALLNLAYSLFLKQIVIVDVITLASVYTLRLLAGSAATAVATSYWLFAFSMFIFISLALMKRYIELANLHQSGKHHAVGRGYKASDHTWVYTTGVTSGYLSLVVLALYISSTTVAALYTHPYYLWAIVVILFIWIHRVWILVKQDQVHDDPIVFALSDKLSYLSGILTAIVLTLAI